MTKNAERLCSASLIGLLCMVTVFAEASPQNPQDSIQPVSQPQPNSSQQSQGGSSTSSSGDATTAPASAPLPDAPSSAQPQQRQGDRAQENPQTAPSGTAAAKAASPKGAPAARPIGAAIAPAKQRERRSLLIKVGLLAGACVAVGSAVALSKASPSKPPGAP